MSRRRTIGVIAAVVALLCVVGLVDSGNQATDASEREAAADSGGTGWQRLSLPPQVRDGSSLLATGDQLLLFGGCGLRPKYDCRRTRSGYSYTPDTDHWSRMPKAPFGPMGPSVWTGSEAVFLNTGTGYKRPNRVRPLRAIAFDPGEDTWRRLPPAPLRAKGSSAIWTGSEVFVWGGGGHRNPAAADGAAYDPATNSWRRTARAPIGLNNVSLTWTGSEVIAFGSRLDVGNHASTHVAVGAAYSPASDTWHRIADSKLSPQADAATWAGGRMVAYDYGPDYQLYNPARDTWSAKRPMPMRFAECYPDIAATPDGAIAYFCGQVADYNTGPWQWRKVTGGMTRRLIPGYRVNFWGQAQAAVFDDSAYFLATGYSQGKFAHLTSSYWSYSAPAGDG